MVAVLCTFFDRQISLQCRQRNSCQTPRNLKITAIFFPLKTAQFERLPFLGKIASFHYRNLSVFMKIITCANKISPENQWLEMISPFWAPANFQATLWKKRKSPDSLATQEAQFIDLQGKSRIFERFLHLSTTKATWMFSFDQHIGKT